MEWVHDLSIFFQVVLYIAGSVAALTAGVAAIVKLWKWVRKPAEENKKALTDCQSVSQIEHDTLRDAIKTNQQAIEKIMSLLAKDKQKLDAYDDKFKVFYRVMWVMLDHELTGNSDAKMRAVRDELQQHLIDA